MLPTRPHHVPGRLGRLSSFQVSTFDLLVLSVLGRVLTWFAASSAAPDRIRRPLALPTRLLRL
jgi:hypothetical protein